MRRHRPCGARRYLRAPTLWTKIPLARCSQHFPWRPVLPGSAKITLGDVVYLASLSYRGGATCRVSLELNRSRQQQQRTRAQLGLRKVSPGARTSQTPFAAAS